jgi:hypothetical protein
MMKYWVEWICNQTNDKHNTDLYDTQEEALKAVPYRAYTESINIYVSYQEPMEHETNSNDVKG